MTRMSTSTPGIPRYGSAFEAARTGGPPRPSSAQVDADVELPAAAWRAARRPGRRCAPPTWCCSSTGYAASTRGVWIEEDDGVTRTRASPPRTRPGWSAATCAGARPRWPAPGSSGACSPPARGAADVVAGAVRYRGAPGRRTRRADQAASARAAAADRRWRSSVSGERAPQPTATTCSWSTGRCASAAQLPRTLGYIKTHQRQYLPPQLTAVVTGAAARAAHPGVPARHRLARLLLVPAAARARPARRGRASSGSSARADLRPPQAIALADLSAVTLPRFASSPYKDPRAPQNLVPIAGLERRLRGHARRRPAAAPGAARGDGPAPVAAVAGPLAGARRGTTWRARLRASP